MISKRAPGGCCSSVKPASSGRCSRMGLVKGDYLGAKLISVSLVTFWNLVGKKELVFTG
jgi:hypothetical protein